MNAAGFEWPKALRALKAAAEEGSLEARNLYPVEVKALCELVARAPLDDSPRPIAPGMTVTRREEHRGKEAMLGSERRAAYYFVTRFGNRVWQCSLFSQWVWVCNSDRQFHKTTALHPRYIVQALTRSVLAGQS